MFAHVISQAVVRDGRNNARFQLNVTLEAQEGTRGAGTSLEVSVCPSDTLFQLKKVLAAVLKLAPHKFAQVELAGRELDDEAQSLARLALCFLATLGATG